MATSEPTEIQAEGEINVDEAVKEILAEMEAAVRVVSESGHVRGLEKITGVFDKGEVALILACGVCKYQEYQVLK